MLLPTKGEKECFTVLSLSLSPSPPPSFSKISILGSEAVNAAALVRWRKRHGLTQVEAAAVLGCGRRSIQLWENRTNEIPHYIALACAAVALGITPPPEWN
jgi:DNA-binding XRE family transcriptional regulator